MGLAFWTRAFAPLHRLAGSDAKAAGALRAGSHLRRSIRFEALAVLAILVTTAALTTVASPEGPESRADRQRSAIAPESPA